MNSLKGPLVPEAFCPCGDSGSGCFKIEAIPAGAPGSNICCQTSYAYFELPGGCGSSANGFTCGYETYINRPCALTGGSTCLDTTVNACTNTSSGCVDGDGDGQYGYNQQTCPNGNDCNDGDENIRSGQQETSCFENPRVDEDCDGKANCEDADCRTAAGSACDQECDQDEDGYYKAACGGDDCDDTCFLCDPGNEREDYGLSTCGDEKDNDCDGQIDCADADCAEHQACQGGGGGPPQPRQTYCVGWYSATDYYVYHEDGNSWQYAYTVWEYSTYCALLN